MNGVLFLLIDNLKPILEMKKFMMFEIAGVSEEVAREAMRLASYKLPVKCKFVKREDAEVKNGGEA